MSEHARESGPSAKDWFVEENRMIDEMLDDLLNYPEEDDQ